MLKAIKVDKSKLSREKASEEYKSEGTSNHPDEPIVREGSDDPKLRSGQKKSPEISVRESKKTAASSHGKRASENSRFLATGRNDHKQYKVPSVPESHEQVKMSKAAKLIQAFFNGIQTRKYVKDWLEKPKIPSERSEIHEEISSDPVLRYLLYEREDAKVLDIRPEHYFPLKDLAPFVGPIQSNDASIVLITGGINPSNKHDIFATGDMMLRYNPEENVLNRYSMMPVPRHHHRVVFSKGYLYIIGGYDSRVTVKGHLVACSTFFRYDLATSTWHRLSDMNHARVYHGAVILNNVIFVIGGKDRDGNLLNSVEKYDEENNEWVQTTPGLSIPRMAMGITVHKGTIWAAGGLVLNPNEENLCMVRIVECYNFAENKWTLLKSRIPYPLAFPSLCSTKPSLYLIGGAVLDRRSKMSLKSDKRVYKYNEEEDLWEHNGDLSSPRHDAATAASGNTVYVVGGCDSTSLTVATSIEEYSTVTLTSKSLQQLPITATGSAIITLPIVTEL